MNLSRTSRHKGSTCSDFVPGQQVVWIYRSHITRGRRYYVDVEIVHTGRLRARIRMRTSAGNMLLRWVKPQNLRPKGPEEPPYPYPK